MSDALSAGLRLGSLFVLGAAFVLPGNTVLLTLVGVALNVTVGLVSFSLSRRAPEIEEGPAANVPADGSSSSTATPKLCATKFPF